MRFSSPALLLCAWSSIGLHLGIPSAYAVDPPGWNLAWSDDFNTFDNARWRKETSTSPTNNSLHAYLPQQVTTTGGNLVITSENVPYQNLPYRSGLVTTRTPQKYGRWEVRAKLPTTRGMWPAIWLLPDVVQHPWPSGGEIDIMEFRGNLPTATSSAFHYGSNPPYVHNFVTEDQQTRLNGQLVNYSSDFHTYAVDWTENLLRFYVDDVHYYSVYDSDVGGFLSQQAEPMQLILNTAVGGDFLPNPDASTVWPQQFQVDWVRVYNPDPTPEPRVFRNGGFDDNSGSLAGWSVFGNDLPDNPNVSAASEAVLAGTESLKLFGTFNTGADASGVTQGISVAGGQEVQASLSARVRSTDSIGGTDNSALLKIEFYNEFGGKFGTDQMLGQQQITIADRNTPTNVWRPHSLTAVAPAGAVEARIAIVFLQPGTAGGAVHVDSVSFAVTTPAVLQGDFNNDGLVDAADYTLWRDNLGAADESSLNGAGSGTGGVDQADYQIWKANFGAQAASSAVAAVAEPGQAALLSCAWLMAHAVRRMARN